MEELKNQLDNLDDLEEALNEADDVEQFRERNVGGWLRAIVRVAKIVKKVVHHVREHRQQKQQG